MQEKQNNRSLTILITALNEERLIELTVVEILKVSRETLDQYEIILVNDGSQDKTGIIMDQLETQNQEIIVESVDYNNCIDIFIICKKPKINYIFKL